MLSIGATQTSALTVISTPGSARAATSPSATPDRLSLRTHWRALWLCPGIPGNQENAYARLEQRFGVNTRRTRSLGFLITRFLGDSVRIFAGAIPLALITGWSIPTSIVLMGMVTLGYNLCRRFACRNLGRCGPTRCVCCRRYRGPLIAWDLAGGPGAQPHRAPRLMLLEASDLATFPSPLHHRTLSSAALSAAAMLSLPRMALTISSCSGCWPPGHFSMRDARWLARASS